ncbi:MAG: transposase [Crocinitomicaceae bacterium]|nr:transposase [Crocinitomicaceae bacterium]
MVIEALKERDTIEDLARKHELHPNQISTWKRNFWQKHPVFFNSE